MCKNKKNYLPSTKPEPLFCYFEFLKITNVLRYDI